MKTIKFTPSGKAISDFEISKFVDEILASEETEFNISTTLVIDEIRARISEKKIGLNDFIIWVTDEDNNLKHFYIDKDGRSDCWTDSMSVASSILMRI